jgi:thiamine pyrophosphokinase
MNDVLIIGGAPPHPDRALYAALIGAGSYVVAVDSGADVCLSAGLVPDLLVGDMDSISAHALKQVERSGARVLRLSRDKDVSDLDAALDEVEGLQPRHLIVSAVWGGRADQSLATIGSLCRFGSAPVDLIEPGLRGWVLTTSARRSLKLRGPGALVSVIAAIEPATVTLEGFRYPLSEQALPPLSSRGMSNVIEGESAFIALHGGSCIVLSTQEDDISPAHTVEGYRSSPEGIV